MAGIKRNNIRVFLIDDHPIVRDGLRYYLTSNSIAVVGEASDDAPETFRKVKKLSPDVIVLGVNLHSLATERLARRLRRLVPQSKILIFSIDPSKEYVTRMSQYGAHGHVSKDRPSLELLEAIINC